MITPGWCMMGENKHDKQTACLLAGLFSSDSVGRMSAYKAEIRGFRSCRSPLFLPLSFHHSDDTAVSFSSLIHNQAGLGLVASDFINHFVD